MASVGTWNPRITRGADWLVTLRVRRGDGTNFPLAGYTGEMVIKRDGVAIMTLSTDNAKMTIDTVNSEVTLSLTDSETASLPRIIAEHHINLTVGSDTRRWVEGSIRIVD